MGIFHKKQTTRSNSTKTHVRFGIYNYFKHWYGIENETDILLHCISYYELRTPDRVKNIGTESEVEYNYNQMLDRMFRYITNHWRDFRNYLSQTIGGPSTNS